MNYYQGIVGYDDIISQLDAMADYIRNREYYKKLGCRVKHNILLVGIPGVGKTSLSKSFIASTGINCITMRRSDTSSKTQLCKAIEQATKSQTATIIFLDDIDKTFNDGFSCDYDFIQGQIDEIDDSGAEIYIVATSNDRDNITPSLERRFNIIDVRSPNNREIEEIVKHYMTSHKCIEKDINFHDVARLFSFKSCSNIEDTINLGALKAARQKRESVNFDDLLQVFYDKYNITDAETNDEATWDDLSKTAVHEAAHLAALMLLDRRGVDAFAFSVVRVGDDGLSTGFVSRFYPPSNNDTYITELLASEAAVNEILGTSDLGSESDIKKVINIIRDYSIQLY